MRPGSRRLDVPHLGGGRCTHTHTRVSPTAAFRWDEVTEAEHKGGGARGLRLEEM